jgi:glycosyltransferase involved in cell wall biosynthesis
MDRDVGKIKVLAVIDHLGGGGAERQFLELAKRVDREKFDLKIFLTEGGGRRLDEARRLGLDVCCESEETGRNTPRALISLVSHIRKTSPDVIMAWLSYSITLTAVASALTGGKKLIFSERSSLERLFGVEVRFGSIKKFILKKAFGRARLVVTNSKAVAAEFNSLGYVEEGRTRVIHNGIDLDAFSCLPPKDVLRRKLGMAGGKVYGIFAGKLEYRKGITFLLEAIEGIDATGFQMIVIGSGSLEPMVRRHPGVCYLGYRDNSAEYMKASDFLVLPSLYEGLPNVVLEAMAVGTPVIAASVSGVPEIIEHMETGLLVEPEDPLGLRAAMSELIGDGGLRGMLGRNALERIDRFEMMKMVRAYEALFLEAARPA